jgi:hypothetical protein
MAGPPAIEGGRGRRQWDATEKALGGASCAAGISPRTCASLGGRPRPDRSLTPADTRSQMTPRRDDALARPKPARTTQRPQPDSRPTRSAAICGPPSTPPRPIHRQKRLKSEAAALDTFIRGVDHPPDLGREGQERDHVLPRVTRGLDERRELLAPFGLERVQGVQRAVGVDCGVDRPQIADHGVVVAAGDVAQRGADEVNVMWTST